MEGRNDKRHRCRRMPEPGELEWFDWLYAHREPRPGLERYPCPLDLFDPIPSPCLRPASLLEGLHGGEVLHLERIEMPGRSLPEFIVRTPAGRELGRMKGGWAAMIEGPRCDGFEVEVRVFVAAPFLPLDVALMLELDIVVWCTPEEWLERPVFFSAVRSQ